MGALAPGYVTGIMRSVSMHITSKRIEQIVANSKPDQPGLSSLIH